MGKSGDPEGEASTANTLSRRDPKMQAAKVHMLNGTSKDFELHRGSDGDVLFTLASTELSIEEREYFSLCFYDEQGIRHWLYNDKKILRQLKGLPWEFSFEVKFYPTAPSTLNDDNARYNLFLQLRKDIATARLPATIPTHALLAACIAQAEYGDADSSAEYEKYLREAQFVPSMKEEQNLEKVKELHREQKGLTASEAEARYLDTCKQLSMYGVFVFSATDSQHQEVLIGVCASGINIYKDTIRMHRFSWQNIVKISYRKSAFSVKLKAGELDKKKETTLVYKVRDYLSAKRIWKCGVEHHTFFRLIQPEDKPKGGLFRWGSTRFRYQGRTQFQTKMASQMFDHPTGTTQRTSTPGRLTQSCDNVNKENIPVHDDKSATLGREGKIPSPTVSPGVSYEIGSAKRAGSTNGKTKKSKKSKGEHEVDSSESSSSDEDHQVKVVPVVETASPTVVEPNSSGKLVRRETKEQSYRLSGEGRSSGFNPEHPSLSTTIAEAERLNQRSPRLEHAERTITVRALAPLPVSFEESGQPHTTVATWQERTQLPDNVTVEYDDQGNRITRTVKTSQVKHTVQKQTFQNYVVPDGEEPSSTLERTREQLTPLGLQSHTGPIVDTQSRSVVYETSSPVQGDEGLGEFVSSKTVTSGNRTIETITYKTERDGIIETHVEHRVTIHSESPIDHDAELSAAIAEATQMNPDMTVEKIEVRQETSS